jgi:hypothetical protein
MFTTIDDAMPVFQNIFIRRPSNMPLKYEQPDKESLFDDHAMMPFANPAQPLKIIYAAVIAAR